MRMDNQYNNQQPQYDPNQYNQQPQFQEPVPPYGQPQTDQYVQQPQYDPNQYVQQPQQKQYVQQQYAQQQYVQQQYAQPSMQQPQQYTRQQMQQAPDDGGRNSHAANVMCVISLICMYVIPFVSLLGTGLLGEIFTKDADYSDITSAFVSFISLFVCASDLAAWVLMIIVRVKYPKNIFGKVLMWLYIIMMVLGVVALIFVMISCLNSLRRCS